MEFDHSKASDKLSYNLNYKNTKSNVLDQIIKRTRHTTNQNQKMMKVLIEKVDYFQKMMKEYFETICSQPKFGGNKSPVTKFTYDYSHSKLRKLNHFEMVDLYFSNTSNLLKSEEKQKSELDVVKRKKGKKKKQIIYNDAPKIMNEDPVINIMADLCKNCQGEFKLTRLEIDQVVYNVNEKGYRKWNYQQLGYALQEELYDANWRAMLYRDYTTQESYNEYLIKVNDLINSWVEEKCK